jgi:hypothetical protein
MATEKPRDAIEIFKDTVLVAAADAVIKEMTPEAMKALVEKILAESLSSLRTDKYSSLAQMIAKKAEDVLKVYLQTPEVHEMIKIVVEEGVNGALKGMAAEAKGKVMDIALSGMVKAITAHAQSRSNY